MKNSVQTKTQKTVAIFFGFLLTTIFYLLSTAPALAQEGPLTVAPARQIIQADPGETKYVNIKFINQADTPIPGVFNVSDFIVTDSSGTPRFLDLNEELTTKYSAASWVSLPYTKGTISARGMLTLQLKVNVPEDAIPGGRYFGVYFEPSAGIPLQTGANLEAGTGITSRLAGLFYLRVKGPISENATVKKFQTKKFWEYGPVEVKTEILNLGNYHITPEAKVILTNMLGRKIAETPLNQTNIFPETSRIYENEIGSTYLFGKYRVSLSGVYGESMNLISAQTSFWAFPWKLVLVIILTITIVVLLSYLVWKNLKERQKKLETKLEEEISQIESLKDKYKDKLPKK